MTNDQLVKIVQNNTPGPKSYAAIMEAVHKYCLSIAKQKKLIIQQLPSDEELNDLDQRIFNADPTGWDTVIKDLKARINKITAAVRSAKKVN